jgi:hypothetical protein
MLGQSLFWAALMTTATAVPASASSASVILPHIVVNVAIPDAAMTNAAMSTAVPVNARAAADPDTNAGSVLVLRVTNTHATPHSARSVVLTCDPIGGTHPEPQTSCNQLSAVSGNITKMPFREDKYCPKIFQPVTAVAAGWWSGNRIDYQQTFANSCMLEMATGPLFKF